MESRSFAELRGWAVRSIQQSRPGDWSVQGFGMMRLYLDPDKVWRLNVWHSCLQVPGVSTIHDHPWHFKSWIIHGVFRNMRFDFTDTTHRRSEPLKPYDYMEIKTGEGGGPTGGRRSCFLMPRPLETYLPGDSYSQISTEVHESGYEDGTVTINQRERVGTGEHARVFWPAGQEWVDAMPRAATEEEFARVIKPLQANL